MRHGSLSVRLIAILSSLLALGGLAGTFFGPVLKLSLNVRIAFQISAFLGAGLLAVVQTIHRIDEYERSQKRVETAEQNLKENQGKPQFAWELAQARLESYLNRNLAQVRSIYLWTVIVMTVGFILIGVGAFEAFHEPEKFQASVLSAISGVLVSFIGGTFLVLYKATMAQAKDYVTILERINAVGMSVQILESLGADPDLQHKSLAEIAKTLLTMYSQSTPRPNITANVPRRGNARKR